MPEQQGAFTFEIHEDGTPEWDSEAWLVQLCSPNDSVVRVFSKEYDDWDEIATHSVKAIIAHELTDTDPILQEMVDAAVAYREAQK